LNHCFWWNKTLSPQKPKPLAAARLVLSLSILFLSLYRSLYGFSSLRFGAKTLSIDSDSDSFLGFLFLEFLFSIQKKERDLVTDLNMATVANPADRILTHWLISLLCYSFLDLFLWTVNWIELMNFFFCDLLGFVVFIDWIF
jgi:hypothetical protein